MNDTAQEHLSKRPVGSSVKRAVATEASQSRKVGSLGNANSTRSSLVSCVALEDPYLRTLQQRHLRERELADRLMRQALNPDREADVSDN